MSEQEVKSIADAADLIVNGYAYTKLGDGIRSLNLCNGHATLFTADHEVSETSMDDIDLALAIRYLSENERFLDGGMVIPLPDGFVPLPSRFPTVLRTLPFS